MKTIITITLLITLAGCIPAMPVGHPTLQPTSSQVHAQPTNPPTQAPSIWVPTMEPGATPTPRCIVDTHGMAPGTVNVRSGPGMNFPVVDIVTDGEELPLFGPEVNGWRQTTTQRLVAGWFYIHDWCKEKTE